jgi:type IX secretion system PorP/SprF family membrane protein
MKKSSNILNISLVTLLLVAYSASAQQDPAYSMFMYNGLTVNPAMAGSAGPFSATALYRKQWIGVEGAPETQTLNVEGTLRSRKVPAPMGRKVGLGLSIVNDQIGVTKNLSVNGQYAYHMQMRKGTLSMGLQAGFNNYKANYAAVVTSKQNTPDNSFAENSSSMIFNFGAGLYYSAEKFYAGFSIPHILNQKLDGTIVYDGTHSRQFRHYYLTGGYVFDAGLKFKIKPAVMLKVAEGAPLQLDVSTTVWYYSKVGLGVSYRTKDSCTGILQVQLSPNLRFGYAYDFLITSMSRYTTGNHELMLRYDLHRKNRDMGNLTANHHARFY